MVGSRTRRIVTRSVSATGGQQGASHHAHIRTLPSSQKEQEQPPASDHNEQSAHDTSQYHQEHKKNVQSLTKKRVSSEVTVGEDPNMESKRPKMGRTEDEGKRGLADTAPTGGFSESHELDVDQDLEDAISETKGMEQTEGDESDGLSNATAGAGTSKAHARAFKTPSIPLKRNRALELVDTVDHPRKRQALDSVTRPRTPRIDLTCTARTDPVIPRSISLPDQISEISAPISGRATPSTAKRRRSADIDTEYHDFVIPLQGEDVRGTPLRSPEPPMLSAQFTFNPFAATKTRPPITSQTSTSGKHPAGDTFGPAVGSLSKLLEGDQPPLRHPSGLAASTNTAPNHHLDPPSPTKVILPSKVKPSMIPRLVLAPPPKPHSAPKSSSPTKSSFTKFFASPVKGMPTSTSAAPVRPPTGHAAPPRFVTGKGGVQPSGKKVQGLVRHSTTLSIEAQASLANLSIALEKLAMPRPRSLGSSDPPEDESRTKSDEAEAEAPFDDELQARLDELPPRPNTSLGVRSVHEGRRAENLARQRGTMGRPVNAPIFHRRAASSNLPSTFLDPNNVLVDNGGDCEPGPSSQKGKEKEREPLATIGRTSSDVMPESDCLAGCVIFVDVKTDDGSDASAMFVQMLRRLSAKIINRPGTTATHFVWKSGLQSTLTRYSSMEEPRPHLVGIGWVVQCVERKQKVEERRFLVNVKEAEIHFGNKRRKSLQVKDRSAMTSGLVPKRLPPQRTASNPNPNPRVIQSASSARRIPSTKTGGSGRNNLVQLKLPFGKSKVPPLRFVPHPSPVKEVVEPQEEEADIKEIAPVPFPVPLRSASPEAVSPDPPESAIGSPSASTPHIAPAASGASSSTSAPRSSSARKEPMFSLTKPKTTPPPLVLQTTTSTSSSSAPASRKADPLADFHTMLADTRSSLLAEAQESQLDRARQRSLLFAPKVSSPLKKNFNVY
ncbi:hypothetical protein FRB93_008945 [Tulasnella sp. JGI-2019a]|nr:hypothetical protein FRB93_008945 [Tulasnella sp. JGI-2019a]